MKTMQIEIRQQNENVQLYNLYVGYNNKMPLLHSMALSFEEAESLGFRVIKSNPEYKPQILIDKY